LRASFSLPARDDFFCTPKEAFSQLILIFDKPARTSCFGTIAVAINMFRTQIWSGLIFFQGASINRPRLVPAVWVMEMGRLDHE